MKRETTVSILAVLLLAACDDPTFPPEACGTIQDKAEVFIGEQEFVSFCFQDPDGDLVSVTATSSDPEVVEAVVQGGAQEVLLTGRDVGQAVITVVARDSEGLSAQQTFAVTVPNRAPEATALPEITRTYGEPAASLTLTEYFTDPDSQPLAFSAAVSDETVVRASVTGDTLQVEPVGSGSAAVMVSATDPHGLQAKQSLRFMVTNRSPVLTKVPKPLVMLVGSSSTLILSDYFEDPDGHELTYSAKSSDPAVVTVSIVGDTMTANAVKVGGASITITATDGERRVSLTLRAQSLGEFKIVLEDDFDTNDGSWHDVSFAGGKWAIEDGKLRMWSPTAGSSAGAVQFVSALGWRVEASVRGAKDAGISMLIGWKASEADYYLLVLSVGDLSPAGRFPRNHYRVSVVRDSEEAITEYGLLDDYDYLEYTTISAGLEDDGELVVKVGQTEVARFESRYVNVVMDDISFFNVRPLADTGREVFVDWVRVLSK